MSGPSVKPLYHDVKTPAGPGSATDLDDKYRDPVTGQSMLTDWRFEFGFKLKLGDKPKK